MDDSNRGSGVNDIDNMRKETSPAKLSPSMENPAELRKGKESRKGKDGGNARGSRSVVYADGGC